MENREVTASADEKFTEKTQTELAKELDAKIPRDAVSKRTGGGNKQLSYVETWYVIDRLNKVFGHLNWSMETLENRSVYSGPAVNGKGEEIQSSHYIAKVRVLVNLASGQVIYKDGTGYGDGTDKTSIGKTHELAAKEAESDAFKRAAMKFGLSLGLALYAKDEDYIDDKPTTNQVPKPVGTAAAETPGVVGVPGQPQTSEPVKPQVTREQVNQLITETSKVIVARRIKTTAELKKYSKDTFGSETKEQLSDTQADQLLAYLKTIL